MGKTLLKNLLKAHVHLGCGCGCGDTHHPNLPDFYQPKPKSKSKPNPSPSSSSSDGGKTSVTFSPIPYCSDDHEPGPANPGKKTLQMIMANPNPNPNLNPSRSPLKIEESIPVVKESQDPYEDFRESMMQMIMEKEIFSQEDLHHLLRRFLRLNSPAHHPLILRAFVDVCHSLFSDPEAYGGCHRTCEQLHPSSPPM